jgi:hypothetical protein
LDAASQRCFQGFEENIGNNADIGISIRKEPMLLYIATTNRVVSAVVVVEREEEVIWGGPIFS